MIDDKVPASVTADATNRLLGAQADPNRLGAQAGPNSTIPNDSTRQEQERGGGNKKNTDNIRKEPSLAVLHAQAMAEAQAQAQQLRRSTQEEECAHLYKEHLQELERKELEIAKKMSAKEVPIGEEEEDPEEQFNLAMEISQRESEDVVNGEEEMLQRALQESLTSVRMSQTSLQVSHRSMQMSRRSTQMDMSQTSIPENDTSIGNSNNNDDLLAAATAGLQALPEASANQSTPAKPGAFSEFTVRAPIQVRKPRYSILRRAHSPVFHSTQTVMEEDAKLPAVPLPSKSNSVVGPDILGQIERAQTAPNDRATLEANSGMNSKDSPLNEEEEGEQKPPPVTPSIAQNDTGNGRSQRLARKREQINAMDRPSRTRSPVRAAGQNTEPQLPLLVPARSPMARSAPVASASPNTGMTRPGAALPGDDLVVSAAAISSRARPPPDPIPEANPAGPLPPGPTRSKGDKSTSAPTGTADLQTTSGAEASPGAYQERIRAVGGIPVWAQQADTAAAAARPTTQQTTEQPGPGTNSMAAAILDANQETPNGEPCDANMDLPGHEDDRLIQAIPVRHLSVLPLEAQPYDVDGAQEQSANKARQEKIAIILVVLVVLAIVLILVLAFVPSWGPEEEDENSPAATSPPSQSPTTISLAAHVLSLLPSYTRESIDGDSISPQAKAYNWVMGDPNLNTYSDERIIQRFALGALFKATNGDRWHQNTHWMSYEVHECQWHAQDINMVLRNIYILSGEPIPEALTMNVMEPYQNTTFPCEDPVVAKQYSHLWLAANGLKGHLPLELNLLTSLRTIVLAINSLTGPGLSTEVGKLSSLEVLSIADNGFSGTIPTQIGLLSKLQVLMLRNNEMTGTIPTEFSLFSDTMKMLDLPYNKLTGTIPQSLASLVEINYLSGYKNQLTGTIPTVLGVLSKLKWLDLGSNELTGPIPIELGLLENLKKLWLPQNNLTGTVPWEIGNLVTIGNLKVFHIHTNNLSGTLPADLCLIDTLSDYNNDLIGCNCSCYFESVWYPGQQMCSPLPDPCT